MAHWHNNYLIRVINAEKTYAVSLNRILHKDDLEKIKEGLQLEDGFIKVDAVSYAVKLPENQIKVALHSGKNRIVRRIFEHLGYEVSKLDRIEYAGLTKKGLLVGYWRFLTEDEVERLLQLPFVTHHSVLLRMNRYPFVPVRLSWVVGIQECVSLY